MAGSDAQGAGGKVRVYIATSLDGFIAGPDDDLTWLTGTDPSEALDDFAAAGSGATQPDTEAESAPGAQSPAPSQRSPGALSYEEFISGVGALLMGRRTYDVVRGFDIPWPYGKRPVLVATNRPLDPDPPASVRSVRGPIQELVAAAREAASGRDVYIDGGVLIRQALDADLIDDLTLTLAPIALGAGLPLFAGLQRPYRLKIVSHHRFDGTMVQLRMKPARTP